MTLLEMVQDILSDMDSDEVNSIGDTLESLQVAQIIRTTYSNIIDGKEWPHLNKLFQLEASIDVARPTHMRLPTQIIDAKYIKYNNKKTAGAFDLYTVIEYKTPVEFMRVVDARKSTSSTILSVLDFTNVRLNILNNRGPTLYTSFDNEYIIFDSYNLALESTLQTSKTQVYGKENPVWVVADSFIPNLPVQSFSYLLNEAKAVAFVILKQVVNPKAEQHSITQRRRMSEEAWRLKNGITFADYGRKT